MYVLDQQFSWDSHLRRTGLYARSPSSYGV